MTGSNTERATLSWMQSRVQEKRARFLREPNGSTRRQREDYSAACLGTDEGRVNGGACGITGLAELSIGPPILVGGLAATGVCSQLDRHDIVRLEPKRIGTTL